KKMLEAVDRLRILELYAVQSHAVDSSDGDGWAATFTEDGVFESPTYQLVARGRAELAAFAQSSNDAAREKGIQYRHYINAVVLTSRNDYTVDAQAYLAIMATSNSGTVIERSLVLHDELMLTDSGWLFSSRKTY